LAEAEKATYFTFAFVRDPLRQVERAREREREREKERERRGIERERERLRYLTVAFAHGLLGRERERERERANERANEREMQRARERDRERDRERRACLTFGFVCASEDCLFLSLSSLTLSLLLSPFLSLLASSVIL